MFVALGIRHAMRMRHIVYDDDDGNMNVKLETNVLFLTMLSIS